MSRCQNWRTMISDTNHWTVRSDSLIKGQTVTAWLVANLWVLVKCFNLIVYMIRKLSSSMNCSITVEWMIADRNWIRGGGIHTKPDQILGSMFRYLAVHRSSDNFRLNWNVCNAIKVECYCFIISSSYDQSAVWKRGIWTAVLNYTFTRTVDKILFIAVSKMEVHKLESSSDI